MTEERHLGVAARLAPATLILMAGFVASRASGLLRDITIGATFGTGPDLDAYYAAFRLPDLLFQLLTGAALISAFIPTFSSYLGRGAEEEAWRMAASVLTLLALATAAGSLLAALFAPSLMALVSPGFSAAQLDLVVNLTRVMLLSPVLFTVSTILTGILNTRGHFALPSLAPALYNTTILCGALFSSEPFGVYGLAIGVAAGSALHLAIQLPAILRLRFPYRLAFELRHPGVREVLRLMGPRVAGLAAVQANFLVSTALASTLSPGSLSALNLAWPLMMLPLGVGAVTVASAAFPPLAEAAAGRDHQTFHDTFETSLRVILYLTLPATAGLIFLSGPLVALIYQRGGFGEASSAAVATALIYYALGLPAHGVLEIVTRAFYARKDTLTPVIVGLLSMALHLALSLALKDPLQHGGLALSLSLAATAEALLLLLLLWRRVGALGGRATIGSALRSALASLLMLLPSLGLIQLITGRAVGDPLYILGVVSAVVAGALAYLLASRLLGSGEARLLLAGLRSRS